MVSVLEVGAGGTGAGPCAAACPKKVTVLLLQSIPCPCCASLRLAVKPGRGMGGMEP